MLFLKGAASTPWMWPPPPPQAAQLPWEQMKPAEMEATVSPIRPAVAGPRLPGIKDPLTTCGHVSHAGIRGHKQLMTKELQIRDRAGMATGLAGEGTKPCP